MRMKGAVAFLGMYLIIIAITVMFMVETHFKRTEMTEIALDTREAYSIVNYAEGIKRAVDSGSEVAAVLAAKELSEKGGGVEWSKDFPNSLDDIKVYLKSSIKKKLDKISAGNEKLEIEFEETEIDITEIKGYYFIISGKKPFFISNAPAEPTVNMSFESNFNRKVNSNYFKLARIGIETKKLLLESLLYGLGGKPGLKGLESIKTLETLKKDGLNEVKSQASLLLDAIDREAEKRMETDYINIYFIIKTDIINLENIESKKIKFRTKTSVSITDKTSVLPSADKADDFSIFNFDITGEFEIKISVI